MDWEPRSVWLSPCSGWSWGWIFPRLVRKCPPTALCKKGGDLQATLSDLPLYTSSTFYFYFLFLKTSLEQGWVKNKYLQKMFLTSPKSAIIGFNKDALRPDIARHCQEALIIVATSHTPFRLRGRKPPSPKQLSRNAGLSPGGRAVQKMFSASLCLISTSILPVLKYFLTWDELSTLRYWISPVTTDLIDLFGCARWGLGTPTQTEFWLSEWYLRQSDWWADKASLHLWPRLLFLFYIFIIFFIK